MLRAARLLLLLLAVSPGRAYFEVIRPSRLQFTGPAGSQAYISGWPHTYPSTRQGPSTARQTGKVARIHSPTVFSRRAHLARLLPATHTILYAQKLHGAPSGKNKPAECLSVSRPVGLPWKRHIVGVWHFYIPSSVYTVSNISTEPNQQSPLPVWISEDGSLSCPDLKCEGIIRPRQNSPVLDAPDCE